MTQKKHLEGENKNCRRNNPNINAEECWDFWECPDEYKKKCPAYIHKMGDECWLIVGSFTKKSQCPLLKKEFKSCYECAWFRLKHPKIDKAMSDQFKCNC